MLSYSGLHLNSNASDSIQPVLWTYFVLTSTINGNDLGFGFISALSPTPDGSCGLKSGGRTGTQSLSRAIISTDVGRLEACILSLVLRATLSSPLTNPALGIPLITQSDLGTENYGIANCHTVTRQRLDPSLEGTMQHQWMKEKMNIKPEATWSQMRRQFTPGFETIMDKGVARGLYNVDKPLEKYSFRICIN
jgi:hypothetical protein